MWSLVLTVCVPPVVAGAITLAGRRTRSALGVALGAGWALAAWLIERPPWPPVSAAQHLYLLAPGAGLLGMVGGRWRAIATGLCTAAASALLLRRAIGRQELGENIAWILIPALIVVGLITLLERAPAGSRGPMLGVAVAGLVGAVGLAGAGAAFLGIQAGTLALIVAVLAAVGPGGGRRAAGCALFAMACVTVVGARYGGLPPGAAVLMAMGPLIGARPWRDGAFSRR